MWSSSVFHSQLYDVMAVGTCVMCVFCLLSCVVFICLYSSFEKRPSAKLRILLIVCIPKFLSWPFVVSLVVDLDLLIPASRSKMTLHYMRLPDHDFSFWQHLCVVSDQVRRERAPCVSSVLRCPLD